MKAALTFLRIVFLLMLHACALGGLEQSKNAVNFKTYANEIYRFSVDIPETWSLYGEILNDTINRKFLVDWGLPKIYSELEKTEIENSISIAAYKRSDINSVGQLIVSEYLENVPRGAEFSVDDSCPNARFITFTPSGGSKYQGKSYFEFKNGIGYVITFMATPGTYSKNIQVFETFYSRIKFF